MNGVAPINGANAFPNDPSGRGAGWGNFEFERAVLAAARANAPYTDPQSGIKLTVTQLGLKVELDGPVVSWCENGQLVRYVVAAKRIPELGG